MDGRDTVAYQVARTCSSEFLQSRWGHWARRTGWSM